MRVFQGLGTPTKKPGFYRIYGLQSIIFVKNPVSGASPPTKETGFLPESVGGNEVCRQKPGFWASTRAIGYNIKKIIPKTTVMKELIQQELEKLDREQLKQVFEFIAFLKFRARLVTIPAIDETNLAALYSEFAEEDRQLAELGISEYADLLKHEDLV
jgi:hypothetical protein